MLVLSRKENERIILGDDIVLTVLRIGGDQIRIGIDAPRNIVIMREELQKKAGRIDKPPAAKAMRKSA